MIKVIEVKKVLTKKLPVICKQCGGGGSMIDDSWGSGFSDMIRCTNCNNTGRTIEAELVVIADIPFDFSIKT